jgi:hypothetical protein
MGETEASKLGAVIPRPAASPLNSGREGLRPPVPSLPCTGPSDGPGGASALPPGAKRSRSGSAKRRRRHLEQFRTDDAEHDALHAKVRASGSKSLGEFVMQLAAIASGPKARSRRRAYAVVDNVALMSALVAFNREHNNYNQAVRALNTLVLVAEERSNGQLAHEIGRLQDQITLLQQQFAAPLAAILGAVQRDL